MILFCWMKILYFIWSCWPINLPTLLTIFLKVPLFCIFLATIVNSLIKNSSFMDNVSFSRVNIESLEFIKSLSKNCLNGSGMTAIVGRKHGRKNLEVMLPWRLFELSFSYFSFNLLQIIDNWWSNFLILY